MNAPYLNDNLTRIAFLETTFILGLATDDLIRSVDRLGSVTCAGCCVVSLSPLFAVTDKP